MKYSSKTADKDWGSFNSISDTCGTIRDPETWKWFDPQQSQRLFDFQRNFVADIFLGSITMQRIPMVAGSG